MNTDIFLDSGAPSFYNIWARKVKSSGIMGARLKDRKHDDHSYLTSEDYLAYREKYAQFIEAHLPLLTVYANLDIINNAEATWQNQLWFEARGLKPLPVWHFGTDESYLKRYIKKGYEYIAIGGMIPNASSVLIGPLDRLWSTVLTDSKGMPVIKVHGFAMTAFSLMRRYPWYSVDSSSWIKVASYGRVFVPRKDVHGKWDWGAAPHPFSISDIGRSKGHGKKETPLWREQVFSLFEEMGFPVGKSRNRKGHTVIIEPGLSNDYLYRIKWNAFQMAKFMETIPEWPWAVSGLRRDLI